MSTQQAVVAEELDIEKDVEGRPTVRQACMAAEMAIEREFEGRPTVDLRWEVHYVDRHIVALERDVVELCRERGLPVLEDAGEFEDPVLPSVSQQYSNEQRATLVSHLRSRRACRDELRREYRGIANVPTIKEPTGP